jgi:hypothetical protein
MLVTIVFQDRVANGNALVADVSSRIIAGRGDELTDNVLTFMAEGTTKGIV